jgi:excisionase family DNA binding protein
MEKNFYTVEEVAGMLSMHPKTIRRYIREGRLAATRIGKSYVIHGHALSRFTESGTSHEDSTGPVHMCNGDTICEVTVSTVVDIGLVGSERCTRIVNTLIAALNSKSTELGQASLHSQYEESEMKLRIFINGRPTVVATMLKAIASLTEVEAP